MESQGHTSTTGSGTYTRPRRTRSGVIARTAIFTAFVAAVTMALAVYIPATKGYFNIGEVLVYIVAMLMGPYIGAFAGGVGSAISDVILAPVYAPGTLVIKGFEGFIVGFLTTRTPGTLSRRTWRFTGVLLGGVLGFIVALIGIMFLSGQKTIYLGFSYCSANCTTIANQAYTNIGPQFSADFFVPSALWIILGAAVLSIVLYAAVRTEEKLGWTILSILVGGSEMVLGYFLYEGIALQLGFVTASVEVPINVGQVLVGLLVSVPVVRSYKRMIRRNPQGGQ